MYLYLLQIETLILVKREAKHKVNTLILEGTSMSSAKYIKHFLHTTLLSNTMTPSN